MTRGNRGIGYSICLELCRHGALVFLAARNRERASEAIIQSIQKELKGKGQIEFLEMDLNDLDSVRKGALEFLGKEIPLDILINNGGGVYLILTMWERKLIYLHENPQASWLFHMA